MQISTSSYINLVSPPAQNMLDGRNITTKGNEISSGAEEATPRIYDFTNISRREFDELWKSGEIDMKLPPLILPEGGLDLTRDTKAQMDAVYDNKINFIDFFEKSIAFQKTLPSTEMNRRTLEHYQNGLNDLMELQGKARQPSIDILA